MHYEQRQEEDWLNLTESSQVLDLPYSTARSLLYDCVKDPNTPWAVRQGKEILFQPDKLLDWAIRNRIGEQTPKAKQTPCIFKGTAKQRVVNRFLKDFFDVTGSHEDVIECQDVHRLFKQVCKKSHMADLCCGYSHLVKLIKDNLKDRVWIGKLQMHRNRVFVGLRLKVNPFRD